jgi:hypothetical protein
MAASRMAASCLTLMHASGKLNDKRVLRVELG